MPKDSLHKLNYLHHVYTVAVNSLLIPVKDQATDLGVSVDLNSFK